LKSNFQDPRSSYKYFLPPASPLLCEVVLEAFPEFKRLATVGKSMASLVGKFKSTFCVGYGEKCQLKSIPE